MLDQIAMQMAFSRGRIARARGEGKTANPYREDQCYFRAWADGWEEMGEFMKYKVQGRPE
jgi:hypothetical protein